MTTFKTAFAGLRASIRIYLSVASGAGALTSSEVLTVPTTPVVAAARLRPATPKSPRIPCLKPTSDGAPCTNWALLIDPITYASGCRWHASDLERRAWKAARQELARV